MPDNMKEQLIKWIEESGMLDNQSRCSILADELIAHGVTLGDSRPRFIVKTSHTGIADLQKALANPAILYTDADETIIPIMPAKWIPVSERLPKDYEKVLICSVIGNQYVAQYFCEFFYVDGLKIGTSHWMPLPEPPKEN